MSPVRLCLRSNGVALPGKSSCAEHAIPQRSGTSRRASRRTVEGATYCYICGEPPRPGDPLVADHVIPRAFGGPDTLDNLAPAHRSCKGRKSAKLAARSSSSSTGRPARTTRGLPYRDLLQLLARHDDVDYCNDDEY